MRNLPRVKRKTDGHVVLEILGALGLLGSGSTQRVGGAGAGQRLFEELGGRGNHQHIQAFDGNPVSGFDGGVVAFVAHFGVGLVTALDAFAGALERAVIHEMPDGDFGNQQRHIAQVVDVVVRNHQVVDLLQSGRLDGFQNPVHVPAVESGPSRIE